MKINESDIRRMIETTLGKLLNEGVSSVVYHYTHPSSLLWIIKTNKFEMSDDGGMSVTRQRNDRIGYATAFREEYFDGAYVRLQLDGNKLNARFKGGPVDEFGARGEMTMNSFHGGYFSGRRPFYTQAEDKFFSRNGESIENAIYYIDRIDIQFLIEDERYDSMLDDIDEFMNELVSLTDGTPWENKIFVYFSEEGNRKDFNYQTDNCYKISDIKQELKSGGLNEGADYDILYRGIGNGQDPNVPVLWLTTSSEYCENYGGTILKYIVPMKILDSLASEKEAIKYLIKDTDEYPFYEAEYFNIEQMRKDGFTGYYYHEEEYDCLNVCLFDRKYAKLIEN